MSELNIKIDETGSIKILLDGEEVKDVSVLAVHWMPDHPRPTSKFKAHITVSSKHPLLARLGGFPWLEVDVHQEQAPPPPPAPLTEESWAKVTLSGTSPDPEYKGPAPAPIDETGMHKDYWVLPPEERAKGFIRPVRRTYHHLKCGTNTTMARALAETYARNPKYYGATFCVGCKSHMPVGANGEFVWVDHRDGLITSEKVGT